MDKAPAKSSSPSFKSAWGVLIVAVAVELIGRIITGVMANSARNLALGNYINSMNQITMMQGIIDLIAVILVVISIILFIRVFVVRSKVAKNQS